jgi:BirA family biotin operon repressor/biotin-[acetyl-CoA-carboxylase] ligase
MHFRNFNIEIYDQIESTNRLAFELASSNQIQNNHVILAKKQTGGKGRYGRVWQSNEGNCFFSLLLKPQNKTTAQISNLSFVAAAAMNLTIQELSPKQEIKISNKWPNDILINGKKTAGILLESSSNQNQINFVIIGIGVNLISYPDNALYPATSLENEGFRKILPENLLKNFLEKFADLYQKWQDFGFKPTRNLWLQNAFNLNKEILVNLPNQKIQGVFKDLDENGNLILELKNGEVKIIASGEIFN